MIREARAANRVDHAHIVDIHDIGETEAGQIYLVMEFLEGESLSNEIARGPMKLARAADILEQVSAAVARAHDLGVVHRDLKPDNILLSVRGGRRDFVKILDFGLAHLARDARLHAPGSVYGTAAYLAPELARGEEPTPSTDLYAIGIIFYEMLTGRLPFGYHRQEDILKAQIEMAPPPPSTFRRDIPPAAEAVVMRLLEKSPTRRFRDAHHLHDEFKALLRAAPSSPWEMVTQEPMSPDDKPTSSKPAAPGSVVSTWALQASLLGRMVARQNAGGEAPGETSGALDDLWSLSAAGTKLEGEMAVEAQRLEAMSRQGRGFRAELGRKVEELAQAESRLTREMADDTRELDRLRGELDKAEEELREARAEAKAAGASPDSLRAAHERVGAAGATLAIRREAVSRKEAQFLEAAKSAADMRNQINSLRSQLDAHSDSLESDLEAVRARVAEKVRAGKSYEERFTRAASLLSEQVRDAPECRELYKEYVTLLHLEE